MTDAATGMGRRRGLGALRRPGRRVLALVLVLPFLAIGLVILAEALGDASRAVRAEGWPSAPARITRSEIVAVAGETGRYRAEVVYRYTVSGRAFEGRRIAFGYAAGRDRAYHAALSAALPQGEAVLARYDPRAPAEATLATGIDAGLRTRLVAAGVWVAIAFAASALLLAPSRAPATPLDSIQILTARRQAA